MSNPIEITKDGGFYYRAVAFHWAFVSVAVVPVLILTILALVNPFWFRHSMFDYIEKTVGRMARFRDRFKYRLYLGTDPAVWHALKDTNER